MNQSLTILGAALIVIFGCTRSDEQQRTTPKTQNHSSDAELPARDLDKPNKTAVPLEPDADEWTGVYTSPSEIDGFTGTELAISIGIGGGYEYRKLFYSDVGTSGTAVTSGSCLIEGDHIYIPEADGTDPSNLRSSIERYRKLTINDQVVLMRDHAYEAFKTHNKLYDYGILIGVSPAVNMAFDLENAEHKSIKTLYNDKSKKWSDPFIHGPNER